MTYSVTNTSGTASYQVNDGFINSTDLNLDLVGKGVVGYGASLNTNFVKLLENFSNTSPPTKPIQGQLWWDSLNQILKVFDVAGNFIPVNPSVVSSLTIGSLLYQSNSITAETVNSNVNIVSNGTGFVTVNRLGITGTTAGRVLFVGSNGAVQTNSMQYTPTSDTLTVANVNTTNLAGTLTTAAQPNITSVGTLNNLVVTGNISATGNITAGINATFTGNLSANNITASTALTTNQLTVLNNLTTSNITATGTANIATINGTHAGPSNGTVGATTPNTGAFTSVTVGTGNVSIDANGLVSRTGSNNYGVRIYPGGGSSTTASILQFTNAAQNSQTGSIVLDSASQMTIGTDINVPVYIKANAAPQIIVDTGGNLIPYVNGIQNLGTTALRWNMIWGRASSATYADLAENYEADENYEPGTVVEFGGDFEITEAGVNSTRVAGIISSAPGYLMNSEAVGNFILPVALAGRVPCKVIGPVTKGDMLVSAGDGYAIASMSPAVGTVVGKALANLSGGTGVIEVVVGRC
jgi:hypothetical protein